MDSAPDTPIIRGSVTGPGTFPITLERHSALVLCRMLDAERGFIDPSVEADFVKIINSLKEWCGYVTED